MSLHIQGFMYCGDVTGLRLEKFEHEDDGHDGGSRSAVLVVEAAGHDLEIGLLFADAASYEAVKAVAFDTCNTEQAAAEVEEEKAK